MALKATIFKLHLHVADIDRHYYHDHSFTMARHPSETDLRMMIRIAAFALNASESLTFCKGISTEEEPDLWQKNFNDEIEHWVELGQVDEKRIRQACGKAQQVTLYTYQPKAAAVWREQMFNKLQRHSNLRIADFSVDEDLLVSMAQRSMDITATVQDGELSLSSDEANVVIQLDHWF